MELEIGLFDLGAVKSDPAEPAPNPSVLSMWKLFGFTGVAVTEVLVARLVGLFALPSPQLRSLGRPH